MRQVNVGERVGAISGRNHATNSVEVFGFGVYEGDFPYGEEPVGPLQAAVKGSGVPNPRILLDSGERVWGCECWWGPEAEIRQRLANVVSEIVAPSVARERAKKAQSAAEAKQKASSFLADEWKSYRESATSADAGPVQVQETRRAFYAGAAAMWKTIMVDMVDLDPGTEATDDDLKRMDGVFQELAAFERDLREGRA